MSIKFKRWLKGLSKSLTAHSAALLMIAGYMQTQNAWLTKTFGPEITGNMMMGIGFLMVLLRAKTAESLESKGAK